MIKAHSKACTCKWGLIIRAYTLYISRYYIILLYTCICMYLFSNQCSLVNGRLTMFNVHIIHVRVGVYVAGIEYISQ